MKQLMYISKNTLHWWDVDEPELQHATDAIVRPLAVGRCDGDKVFLFNDITHPMQLGVALHYLDPVTIDLLGRRPYQGPFPIGHECVGEVVSCGAELRHLKRGDKVIVPWAISCGSCTHCGLGLTSKCLAAGNTLLAAYGFGESMGAWGGMLSDVIRVPFADAMLVRVPPGIDHVSVASAGDNLSDGYRTVAPHLRQRPGAPVLVVAGAAESIGLYAAAIAVALGSSQVDYVDYRAERLQLAASLGVNAIEAPQSQRSRWYRRHAPRINGCYPITVDASAHADGLRYAIRSLAPGGTCTSVGYYFQRKTGLPLLQMYANDSKFHTGISHPRAVLPELLALIQSGKLRPEKITTLLAPWDDAADAYLERTTKVVIHRPAVFAKTV